MNTPAPAPVATVLGRFRPNPRGFGFVTPVGRDQLTPATFTAPGAGELDSVFVPPPVAKGLLADDLVNVEVAVDEKGASAVSATTVQRPRMMIVGTVVAGPGGTLLQPDEQLGSGWIALAPDLATRLTHQIDRQVVAVVGADAEGTLVARSLVAGPHVVGSPAAIRAKSVVIGHGRGVPALIPGGAAGAGLDAGAAVGACMRQMGLLASGGRGGAAGLSVDGPVPGADLHPWDRRDEVCVTIDSASTRDIDDAIHASWSGADDAPIAVAVHIADVARVVGIGSEADTYARVQATSSYFAIGDSAPMLDPALSEDQLSLVRGEERHALSARFTVQPDGSIGEVDVEAAVIVPTARLTYAAVEPLLTDGDRTRVADQAGAAATQVLPTLDAIAEAARRLGVARTGRATTEELFTNAAIEPGLSDKGRITSRPAEPHAEANLLVERLMVAANEAVAAWLQHHEVAALYRVHAGLDRDAGPRLEAAAHLIERGELVDGLAGAANFDADALTVNLHVAIAELREVGKVDPSKDDDADLLTSVLTGATARANYSATPGRHVGLGAAAYTHFTSPIRRYADLVVHRQIRALLAEEQPLHDAAELAGLAPWLDARSGVAGHTAAMERNSLWDVLISRGVLDDAGEPATITAVMGAGLRVRIDRLGYSAFVPAEAVLGLARGERGMLDADVHRLTTFDEAWRVGRKVRVRQAGREPGGRPRFTLVTD